MIDCTVQLLTAQAIDVPEAGNLLLSALLKHFPTHVPQRCGTSEPLKKSVDARDPFLALDAWGSERNFMMKRASPKAFVHVIFEKQNAGRLHSSVSFIRFQLRQTDDLGRLDLLVRELSQRFEADYGMAHILTRAEFADRLENRLRRPGPWPEPPAENIAAHLQALAQKEGHALVLWRAEASRLHTVHLRKCLPSLYWLNVFGPPYVELFGKEHIAKAPAEDIKWLDYGGVAIRLAKDLADTSEAWNRFKTLRTTCAEHLDSDAFCDSLAPNDHQYRTPDFSFSKSA